MFVKLSIEIISNNMLFSICHCMMYTACTDVLICSLKTLNFNCIGPSDYQSGVKIAIFEVGSSTAKVTYSTVQDDVREGLETFRATLNVSEAMQDMGVRVEEPDTAVVDIRDDEGKESSFTHISYCVHTHEPVHNTDMPQQGSLSRIKNLGGKLEYYSA